MDERATGWFDMIGDQDDAATGARRCERQAALFAYVFSRPPGEIAQELGGVSVGILVLATAAGLSADEEECREIARVLSRPLEEFARRNKAKNDAGLLATAPRAPLNTAK
jgi:hypothetical protein